jgi:type 1 glutamine amidotransferase
MKELLEAEGFDVDFEPDPEVEPMMKKLEASGYKLKESIGPLQQADYLKDLDLIVFCHTMSEISPLEEKNLINAVMDGVGLVGWHGGLCDSFRNNVEYQFMTGAQWVSHPGGAGTTYQVNFLPSKKDDPIIKGLEDFTITSEQYYMHVDPTVEVLATTTFKSMAMPWINGAIMPVVYKKRWGEGKIFYASFGHTVKDFSIPQAKEVMRRGMLWAAEKEELDFDTEVASNLLKGAF